MTQDYPVPRRYAWYAFTLLSLLTVCSLIDRAVIASLLPQLRSEWDLSDSQLGALISAVNWSMALFALPAALLVDRWSRKKAMGLMAMIWTLATVFCGFAGSFVQLLAARFFIGAGEGGFGSGGASIISSLFPDRLRATAFGFFTASGSLGGVLGVAMGGYVAVHWGWRTAFFVAAVPGFLIAILFMLTVRDSPTIALKVADRSSGQQRALTFRELALNLVATPSLVAVYLAGIGVIFFSISMNAELF
jgi:predicted MFS family arabinose efflux permease